MEPKPLIEFHKLSKTYREGETEHVVFRDLDAVVNEGEFVVLVGRSGSGKSTFLNLISGIDLPTRGEITVDGVSITRMQERERTLFRRRNIGFVFQSFNLIPTLTVFENLLLPLELNHWCTKERQDRALTLLDQFGLSARSKSLPDRLSGGEQQRVAIARALVHEPPLVLADEPTGNLDLETGREVVAMLDRGVRAGHKTMVMVTHSPQVVGLADRILTIRDGRLAELESDSWV